MFRPCIDLHDGVVKQIVGGTLKSAAAGESETPTTNFVASLPAEHYAACVLRSRLPRSSLSSRTSYSSCTGSTSATISRVGT